MADDVRSTFCDAHSVVLFYQGTIAPDTIAFLDIPVPSNLRQQRSGNQAVNRHSDL